ncbi:hypothetical protein D1872_321890 [compost metagenome]
MAWTAQWIGLCHPHLMLTHVGSDNDAVINATRSRQYQPVRAQRIFYVWHTEREFTFQTVNQILPFVARLRFNLRH